MQVMWGALTESRHGGLGWKGRPTWGRGLDWDMVLPHHRQAIKALHEGGFLILGTGIAG